MGQNDLRTDEELVQAIAEGDESALRTIMDLYAGPVLSIATRVLADRVFAEEAAQDTFVALWTNPGRFDGTRGSLKNFLMGIARNKAIDMVRREETRRRATVELAVEETVSSSTFDRIEERSDLDRAMNALTARQRQALDLAYFRGLTYREVARTLGVPEGTAKTRLRDALAALRSKAPQLATMETR